MPGAVVHDDKGLDTEGPNALVLESLILGQRSCVVICLSGQFFIDLCSLCFEKGALGSDMPIQTAVMAYGRFSDDRRLLSTLNISIDFVIPFFFNSGWRLGDCRLN
jgi:hypothetical protein